MKKGRNKAREGERKSEGTTGRKGGGWKDVHKP